jgi:hypothetical protein
VLLPASSMPTAAGAYAASTGTIYLNEDWLQTASQEQLLAVLTEELGHHLDNLLNVEDTPGDEGALFAGLLDERELNAADIQSFRTRIDGGLIALDDAAVSAEFSSANRFKNILSPAWTVRTNGSKSINEAYENSVVPDGSGGIFVAWGYLEPKIAYFNRRRQGRGSNLGP